MSTRTTLHRRYNFYSYLHTHTHIKTYKQHQGKMANVAASSQQIIASFNKLQTECNQLRSKVAELDNEMQEHLRVVKTLEPLPASRRAFRLIGGVLVEKTVGEVLPDVKQQQEQLNQLILRLTDTITEKEKDLKKMQKEFDLQKKELLGQGGKQLSGPGILA